MSKGLHRFTVFVTAATFLLIIAGANVTSHDAGLATNDWPLSNGQVFPEMQGNLFWEHGHRLIAASVGILVILLNIWLWRSEKRSWMRRLGLVALGAVVAQGLLGGLTVKLMLPLVVSAAHATLAQLVFCTMVSLSVFTMPGWSEPRATVEEKGSVSLRYLCIAAAVMILIQLVLGATLRHSATWDQHLPTSLLLSHLGGALLVTLLLGATIITTLRRHAREIYLTRPAQIAAALLVGQLFLGLAAYSTRQASPNGPQPLSPMVAITVAHVACGALVFAVTIVLALRAFRVLRSSHETSRSYQRLSAEPS
ncbi:MAG: heme a synthase [Acidobacteriota bacterium]|jgi:cytochrome c oxidase assembly protein subunit 15|nr:heme a synthase [Acidobacteriota bacterium]